MHFLPPQLNFTHIHTHIHKTLQWSLFIFENTIGAVLLSLAVVRVGGKKEEGAFPSKSAQHSSKLCFVLYAPQFLNSQFRMHFCLTLVFSRPLKQGAYAAAANIVPPAFVPERISTFIKIWFRMQLQLAELTKVAQSLSHLFALRHIHLGCAATEV